LREREIERNCESEAERFERVEKKISPNWDRLFLSFYTFHTVQSKI